MIKAKTLYVNMLKSLFFYSISFGFGEKLVFISGAKIRNIWVDSCEDAKFRVST